jgi:hypothetical protein
MKVAEILNKILQFYEKSVFYFQKQTKVSKILNMKIKRPKY